MLNKNIIYYLDDNEELRGKRKLSSTVANMLYEAGFDKTAIIGEKEFNAGEIYNAMFFDSRNSLKVTKVVVVQKSNKDDNFVFVCPIYPIENYRYNLGAIELGKLYLENRYVRYIAKYRDAMLINKKNFALNSNDLEDVNKIGNLDLSYILIIKRKYQKVISNKHSDFIPLIENQQNLMTLFSC